MTSRSLDRLILKPQNRKQCGHPLRYLFPGREPARRIAGVGTRSRYIRGHDRAGTNQLNFTQDSIAAVLGTRRATISVAAATLRARRLISYSPGTIKIESRRRLVAAACRCYNVINSSKL